MRIDWQALVKQTFMSPKDAAVEVMLLRRGLSSETLWSAVVLVAILNALIISLGFQLFPPTAEEAAMIPRFYFKPGLLAVFATGAIVITIFVFHWAGRALGGQGNLRDMLAVISWLELVQAGIQVVTLLVALVLPPVAGVMSTILMFWVLWMLIAFIDAVHGFGTPLKSIGVLALSLGLLVVGVMLFVLLFGAFAEGFVRNV